MNRRYVHCVAVVSLLWLAEGCERHEKQHVIEDRSACAIIRLLSAYELEHPELRATNLVELIPKEQGYPHNWHQQFRAFGKHAGFTNSIYEKYVFFARGITSKWIRGELYMMNARPFPGPKRGLQRKVFFKQGDSYGYVTMPEDVVQRVFREIGITETKPIPMRAPPPAPIQEQYGETFHDKRYKFFVRCAEGVGMSYREWWIPHAFLFGSRLCSAMSLNRSFLRRL